MTSTPDSYHITYIPVEDAEEISHYRPGGYHPVTPGDRLSQGRYTILNKLGYGGYSTVWMARDEPSQRFIAVKIHRASVDTAEEREILSLVGRSNSSSRYILPFLDAFAHDGPNGSHECLVSEPCGLSLLNCKEYPVGCNWIFPLEVARAIAAQMILATSFIHSHGIVHGDLHLGNFMLRIPFDLNALTTEEYLVKYPYYTTPVERLDGLPVTRGVPPLAVMSNGIGKACNDLPLADARVVLADFGHAWQPAKRQVFHLSVPRMFLPPEALFAEPQQSPLGAAGDVWTLAHSLYGMFTPGALLQGSYRDDHDVFAKSINLLGHPPPDAWFNAWSARDEFFNVMGEWEPTGRRTRQRLGTVLSRLEAMRERRRKLDDKSGVVLSDAEFADFKDVILSMLQWLPEDRITAKQLADGVWMRAWGIPALNMVPHV